jgi:hypothetical protein
LFSGCWAGLGRAVERTGRGGHWRRGRRRARPASRLSNKVRSFSGPRRAPRISSPLFCSPGSCTSLSVAPRHGLPRTTRRPRRPANDQPRVGEEQHSP